MSDKTTYLIKDIDREKWKAFSVDSTVPLERILKRFDNAASYFKSTFKTQVEQVLVQENFILNL